MSDTNVETFPSSAVPSGERKNGSPSTVAGVSGERLKSFIDRIERLEEEKKALAEDIKDVYAEAKATGYETRIMRKIVGLRKMDSHKRREEEELLDLYKSAIGMVD